MIFKVINAINDVENTQYFSNKRNCMEILQEIDFHNLSFKNSTFYSPIRDKSSAKLWSRTFKEFHVWEVGAIWPLQDDSLITGCLWSNKALAPFNQDLFRLWQIIVQTDKKYESMLMIITRNENERRHCRQACITKYCVL